MKFTEIKLTDADGKPVYVNIENISYYKPFIKKNSEMTTSIYFIGGHFIDVKESLEKVISSISGANRKVIKD